MFSGEFSGWFHPADAVRSNLRAGLGGFCRNCVSHLGEQHHSAYAPAAIPLPQNDHIQAISSCIAQAKFTQTSVACPVGGGCATVLTGEYSELFGVIPLSALGVLGYGTVAALAYYGLSRANQGVNLESGATVRMLLSGGGLLLATCSAYLM